ncbi:MAG: molybdenum cofactor guanylyltransferase [Crocinitomicaceae bacterium]|nr:molybdenum cofactor guanylyltransferase [Crocinitomicaceae bacterium]
MEDLTVIILAGGKSSRMGEDKGLMTLFGKPMVEYVIDNAKEVSEDIIIVSNNNNYKKFGFPVIKDKFPDKGPLGGIYTGLLNSNSETNIILSCDIPYIKSGLIKFLFYQSDGYDITIPIHQERIHPLIGIYKKNCVKTFEKNLQIGQLKVTKAFGDLITNIVEADEFDEIEFKNLNSKLDIPPL